MNNIAQQLIAAKNECCAYQAHETFKQLAEEIEDKINELESANQWHNLSVKDRDMLIQDAIK